MLKQNVPQYFFDDSWIDNQQRLTRCWLPAQIYPYPVLEPDRPWEGRALALFGTILKNRTDGYRMYYSCFTPGAGHAKVMLAESTDGLSWSKPDLGLVQWRGESRNNLVVAPSRAFDSPSLTYNGDDKEPYKMLAFQAQNAEPAWAEDWGLYGYASEDGLRWRPCGRLLRAGDRSNLTDCKQDGEYAVYTRHPKVQEQCGGRAVYRSHSKNFCDWSEPELVLASDLNDETDVELYGMSVFERHGWYLGLLEYWRSATDKLEIHLAFSRDGRHWMRPHIRTPFIASTYDWNRAWSSSASNGPLIINEQMLFYFGGRFVGHAYDSAQQHGAIGYASLPLDRFCALEGARDGRFESPVLEWPGGDLVINADTRVSFDSHPGYCGGEISVEVLSESGEALPDWSGEARAVFIGNTHMRGKIEGGVIRWHGGRSLDALHQKPIRLRFHLQQARLFTMEARAA